VVSSLFSNQKKLINCNVGAERWQSSVFGVWLSGGLRLARSKHVCGEQDFARLKGIRRSTGSDPYVLLWPTSRPKETHKSKMHKKTTDPLVCIDSFFFW
jgi:hypothetical protein